ncbi:putative hydrolase [mine drainage metagenome]|uniref:Putative hydrolase n=1 Tax=mine drainage metagenome TaxID=410659 RepID=A0A1J5P4W9_9ZZZZ
MRSATRTLIDQGDKDLSWRYWHARALEKLGHPIEGRALLAEVANPWDFYGQLATDALGMKVSLPTSLPPAPLSVVAQQASRPGLQRSLALFSIDLRNGSDVEVDQMADEVKAYAQQLAHDSGLSIQIELVSSYPAQAFHPDCINAVQRAAAQLGYSHMPAVSGAGHDAVYAARLAPAGMIFIPCKDGISHNEIEDAKPEHITAGANVLLHAMLERAGVVR